LQHALSGLHVDRAVVVAVVAVRVMQMAVDEVVDVIAVRDLFVAAVRTVDVLLVMAFAVVIRGAGVGIGGIHREHVLIDVFVVRMVQMSVVQIVRMAFVLDGGVAAIRTVLVLVAFVLFTWIHGSLAFMG